MITYAWFIDNITVLTDYNNTQDVVKTVYWRFNGMNEDGFYHTISGSTDIPALNQPFIPFTDLTQEIVEDWLQIAIGQSTIDEFKLSIEQQIQEQMFPKKRTVPPPWLNQ